MLDFAIFRDEDVVPEALRGAVIAVGNFDGVHRGHQALMRTAADRAHAKGRKAAILTFEPHPRAYFNPGGRHFRLTPEPVKMKLCAKLGLEAAFVRRFDRTMAATSAQEFVEQLLARDLAASGVVIGHDFHFGRGRGGTPALLADLAGGLGLEVSVVNPVGLGSAAVPSRGGGRGGTPADLADLAGGLGLEVSVVDAVALDGAPISSSRIRALLEAGQVEAANELLGYRWFVAGPVEHGAKRGRTLGYPTANLQLDEGCGLAHGIYAVRMAIAPGAIKDGVASFGRRPTFDGGAPRLETYLFDFSGDLYGSAVEVEFVGWIRAEERFGSADDLVRRMRQDEEDARLLLATATVRHDRSMIG